MKDPRISHNKNIEDKLNEIFPDKKGNTLSSMQIVPQGLDFDTQNKGERIFILTRAAAITNLSWIIKALFYIIVFFVALFFLRSLDPAYEIIRAGIQFAATYIFAVLIFVYIYTSFIKWYFNIYIITDERILDYDFEPFTEYKVSEASLLNIEDVSQTQIGLFPTIFNYGDIIIQTAAERLQFKFSRVPNPSYLRDKIVDLSEVLKKLGNQDYGSN